MLERTPPVILDGKKLDHKMKLSRPNADMMRKVKYSAEHLDIAKLRKIAEGRQSDQ